MMTPHDPRNSGTAFKPNGMFRRYEPFLVSFLRLFDATLGAVLFCILNLFYASTPHFIREEAIIIFFSNMIILHWFELYSSWRFSSFRYELSQIVYACVFLCFFLLFIDYFFNSMADIPTGVFWGWSILWPLVLGTERTAIRFLLRYSRKKGFNVRFPGFAGSGNTAKKLAHSIRRNPWSGTKVLGFFDDNDKELLEGLPFIGGLDDLPDYAKSRKIDMVYLTLPLHDIAKIKGLMRGLADSTVTVHFIPDVFFIDLVLSGQIIFFDDLPIMTLRDSPIIGINVFYKRIMDLLLATAFLVLAAPVFVGAAVIIKMTSPGPVFLKQHRYGLNGQKILIYKFRTMYTTDTEGPFVQAPRRDPRITPVGAFLRRTSIDELPQLINVLQGRMSLVGPRPHPVAMNEQYRSQVPGYMLRHKVRPGMTGLAQIHGFRGETDTLDKMENRIGYDLKYLREWSVLLDLEILVKTIFSLFRQENAY